MKERMVDQVGEGHWRYAVTFIVLSICIILGVGVFSAMNPYKPDDNVCGPPPAPLPGKVTVQGLVAEYYCQKRMTVTGPSTRLCSEESKQWSPGEEEKTVCVKIEI